MGDLDDGAFAGVKLTRGMRARYEFVLNEGSENPLIDVGTSALSVESEQICVVSTAKKVSRKAIAGVEKNALNKNKLTAASKAEGRIKHLIHKEHTTLAAAVPVTATDATTTDSLDDTDVASVPNTEIEFTDDDMIAEGLWANGGRATRQNRAVAKNAVMMKCSGQKPPLSLSASVRKLPPTTANAPDPVDAKIADTVSSIPSAAVATTQKSKKVAINHLKQLSKVKSDVNLSMKKPINDTIAGREVVVPGESAGVVIDEDVVAIVKSKSTPVMSVSYLEASQSSKAESQPPAEIVRAVTDSHSVKQEKDLNQLQVSGASGIIKKRAGSIRASLAVPAVHWVEDLQQEVLRKSRMVLRRATAHDSLVLNCPAETRDTVMAVIHDISSRKCECDFSSESNGIAMLLRQFPHLQTCLALAHKHSHQRRDTKTTMDSSAGKSNRKVLERHRLANDTFDMLFNVSSEKLTASPGEAMNVPRFSYLCDDHLDKYQHGNLPHYAESSCVSNNAAPLSFWGIKDEPHFLRPKTIHLPTRQIDQLSSLQKEKLLISAAIAVKQPVPIGHLEPQALTAQQDNIDRESSNRHFQDDVHENSGQSRDRSLRNSGYSTAGQKRTRSSSEESLSRDRSLSNDRIFDRPNAGNWNKRQNYKQKRNRIDYGDQSKPNDAGLDHKQGNERPSGHNEDRRCESQSDLSQTSNIYISRNDHKYRSRSRSNPRSKSRSRDRIQSQSKERNEGHRHGLYNDNRHRDVARGFDRGYKVDNRGWNNSKHRNDNGSRNHYSGKDHSGNYSWHSHDGRNRDNRGGRKVSDEGRRSMSRDRSDRLHSSNRYYNRR